MDRSSAATVNRRSAVAAILALICSPTTIRAQTKSKPRFVGILGFSNPTAAKSFMAKLFDELVKRGWVEGRNVVFTFLYADGDVRRMDTLAAELVALKPDVIYTTNVPGVRALQRATRDIPIVFGGVGDPVGIGLVKSLRQPGGNVTGFAGGTGDELIGKRLQLLKEWFPHMTRLGVMFDPNDANDKKILVVFQQYGSRLGVQIVELSVRNASDIETVFRDFERERPDAVYVFTGAPMYVNRELIASRAIAARLPTMCAFTQLVEAGLLSTYSMQANEIARQGAKYIDQILRGAKPADLPIEQPTKFELVVNMKTARAIGITVPPSILLRADRVIE